LRTGGRGALDVTQFFAKAKGKGKYNVEVQFLVGDDEGKLLDYKLDTVSCAEDPSDNVGNWGVILFED
jgi:hypothetical protein